MALVEDAITDEGEGTDAPVRRRGLRLRITAAIALGSGFIAVLGMVAAGFLLASGFDTSARLLRLRSLDGVDMLRTQVSRHLDPAAEVVSFLARRIEEGEIDPADEKALRAALANALAGTPQVAAVTFVPSTFAATSAVRDGGKVTTQVFDARTLEGSRDQYNEALAHDGPFWGGVVYSVYLRAPVLNVRHRVGRHGVVAAAVTLGEFSKFVAEVQTGWGAETFILVDGRKVLAHRLLADRWENFVEQQRLPRVDEIGDDVLAAIWGPRTSSWVSRQVLVDGLGHTVSVDGSSQTFLYRELVGYGPSPWIVGQHLPQSELRPLINRLYMAAGAAAALLLVAMILAFRIGRWIGRPIAALAEAAGQIRSFHFDGADLPPSRLVEIDSAARAFNASRAALRWFSLYVPRKLVTRLMADGEASMASRRRVVTVMFTDIVGFTAMAEQMGEDETADLLNAHFAELAACIEETGGVIDKFMGDAVMATWGAIKRSDDHAASACAAALAIAARVRNTNQARMAAGQPPVRLRIGLHSGPVVVGNIGSPGRINFTVVGDTVNAAQRLEVLGKSFMRADDDTVILASEATIGGAGLLARGESVGEHQLTGREEMVRVYRLR